MSWGHSGRIAARTGGGQGVGRPQHYKVVGPGVQGWEPARVRVECMCVCAGDERWEDCMCVCVVQICNHCSQLASFQGSPLTPTKNLFS